MDEVGEGVSRGTAARFGRRRPIRRALGLTFACLFAIGLLASTTPGADRRPSPAIGSTAIPTAVATSTTTVSPTSRPTLTGYTFDDEFDGATVGPVWTRDFSFGGTENSWSSSQSSVASGVLTITAQRSGLGWISDLIDTKTTWTQKYGYFEARMKVPKGAGLWPAFWSYFSQPGLEAEIDTMEVCANPLGANGGKDASLLLATVHWPRGGSRGARIRTVDLSLDFHVYAVEWRADHIAFFLDGVEVWRFTDASHIPTVALPLIVDLAVGGSLCGPSNGLTPNPAFLQIDWVRARP